MFSTTLAWIGVGLVICQTVFLVVTLLLGFPKYRDIMIHEKLPKPFQVMGCLATIMAGLSFILYPVILILDFKIEVLLAVIMVVLVMTIEGALNKKKEDSPEEKEQKAQLVEKSSTMDRVSSAFILSTVNAVLRILPFIVFLVVK